MDVIREDAVLFRDSAEVALVGAYRQDLCSRQLRVPVPLPARATALGNPIRQIVGVRAKEQMAGVCAGRVIARMKNLHSLRDRASE